MKVFVDEDTGPGLARALIASGIPDVDFVANDPTVRKGASDETWIEYAGRGGYLVLSRNRKMLSVEAQRNLLIEERVGIVFLPSRATTAELVELTLRKWDWLTQINALEIRPFAFAIYRNGEVRRKPLSR